MSDTQVIKLQYPRTVGDRQVSQLTLRRPRVKDLKLMDKLEGVEGSVAMIAQLTGEPDALIEELDAADFMAISDTVEGFLPATPGTGKS